MDPVSEAGLGISNLSPLMQFNRTIPRTRSVLGASQGRENEKQIAMTLETSQQKFQVWQNTWLHHGLDRSVTVKALWGAQGWEDIQKLLTSIKDAAQRIEAASREDGKAVSRSKWRRALLGRKKKDIQEFSHSSPTLLDMATELSRSIDELWTYSEVTFDSLHGVFSNGIGLPARDKLLTESLQARAGSLALYSACNASRVDYSFEVDLFGGGSGSKNFLLRRASVSSTMSSRLFYHLFFQERDTMAAMQDMTIESIARPVSQDLGNVEVFKYDDSDLQIFHSSSAAKAGLIGIHPQMAGASPSYFRIAKAPASVALDSETESLAQILYKAKVASSARTVERLSVASRLELAFKLVECGFYLLGTPWLASLSSKRLRRMKTKGRPHPFVLDIQTLDLEDLFFEDPDALAEPSQLFRIGIIMMEIALNNPDQSSPTELQDIELRTSKMLPLVEQSMGSQYCKATAFCLQDRRSGSKFGRPGKYQDPEETGWKRYLTELLEDYYAQVFVR
ncbi:hypothetical protein MMC28_006927 [Mycoblastus sanguinarius]|nr:hypothetical protein [Mycoblastus sanguinarius]